MPQPRRFDHDEARRRYAAGESGPKLARAFGVSEMAVYRVVNPTTGAKMAAASAENTKRRRKPCRGGCGRLVWRHRRRGIDGTGYCPTCFGRQRATTVRDETLLCSVCKEWKPDAGFAPKAESKARRHRGHVCHACEARLKREWRAANRELYNAYERERGKSRRKKAV